MIVSKDIQPNIAPGEKVRVTEIDNDMQYTINK